MKKYIMALDAGTTSNRCILFDHEGKIVSIAQKEFTQYFPKPGWVEHDPVEIWSTFLDVIPQAMESAGADATDIAGIGITNQRETTIIWNKETGEPVYNAIVWQCRRTAEFCDKLAGRDGTEDLTEWFRSKTGLVLDAYFSATKVCWILDNVEGVRDRAMRGELLFGTIETWLIWKLTGGRVHVTDYSNASRTMMFNIHSLSWDEEILEKLNIPASLLPEVRPSSCVYGESDPQVTFASIPVAGAAGDQQAALFGQMCFEPGESKNTYGTGCFMLMNTGDKPVDSRNGLVSTIAWGIGDKVSYALEGSVFVAGAAVQWLRDEMKFIESAGDSEFMANQVDDTAGCYVVPAFTGLGAPYWNPYARGGIVGLTRGTTRNHIIRATLDSQAYQTLDVLKAMESDSGIDLKRLKVDGGASANNYMLQMQADVGRVEVVRPRCVESTAMGAAFLAGLAVGFFESLDKIKEIYGVDRIFVPEMDEDKAAELVKGWKDAVQRVM